MLFSIPKIISILLGIIVIAKTLTDYKKKQENWQMMSFWLVIWTVILVIAFYPFIIESTILRFSGRGSTIGQIVGMGFVFLLYIIYRVYIKAQRLENQMGEIIRKLALKDLKKGNLRQTTDNKRPKTKLR